MRFVVLPRAVLLALSAAGVDVDRIARDLGAPSAAARLTPERAEAFVGRALDAVDDPLFGLNVGARVRPELFGIAGLAATTAPTFGEAVVRLLRYRRLVSMDALALVRPATLVVTVACADPRHRRLRADLELAFVVALGRLLTGDASLGPRRVAMRGPAPPPAHKAKYDAFFGLPVAFGAPEDEATFDETDFARPLLSASPDLSRLFEGHANRALEESGEEPVGARVRAALRRLAYGGTPTLAETAKALGTSARTLQRELASSGLSFTTLLHETRADLAAELLAHADVTEVGSLLGFASPSSFRRAFKQWKGATPQAWRKANAPPTRPSPR